MQVHPTKRVSLKSIEESDSAIGPGAKPADIGLAKSTGEEIRPSYKAMKTIGAYFPMRVEDLLWDAGERPFWDFFLKALWPCVRFVSDLLGDV